MAGRLRTALFVRRFLRDRAIPEFFQLLAFLPGPPPTEWRYAASHAPAAFLIHCFKPQYGSLAGTGAAAERIAGRGIAPIGIASIARVPVGSSAAGQREQTHDRWADVVPDKNNGEPGQPGSGYGEKSPEVDRFARIEGAPGDGRRADGDIEARQSGRLTEQARADPGHQRGDGGHSKKESGEGSQPPTAFQAAADPERPQTCEEQAERRCRADQRPGDGSPELFRPERRSEDGPAEKRVVGLKRVDSKEGDDINGYQEHRHGTAIAIEKVVRARRAVHVRSGS